MPWSLFSRTEKPGYDKTNTLDTARGQISLLTHLSNAFEKVIVIRITRLFEYHGYHLEITFRF